MAIGSLMFARSAAPERFVQSIPAGSSTEPARLDLRGTAVKPMPLATDDEVLPTAFPFSASAKSADSGPLLVTPEMATPRLVQPVPDTIPLPSQSASPDPVIQTPHPQSPPQISASVAAAPTAESVAAPPAPAITRPAALSAAVARAEQLTKEGFALGRRGAVYSARSNFFQALRQIAAAQDEVNDTRRFTQSLNSALLAMRESHDFDLDRAASTDGIDVARIVTGHRSEILKQEDLTSLRPAEARDRYQLFAVEQITAAVDREPTASVPLFGLGRICAECGKNNLDASVFSTEDALVWYHAALMADATNFRAAHELGSLYAGRGEWDRARAVLQRAVAIHPHSTTWRNLAAVHEKLGERDWAAAARSRAGAAPESPAVDLPPVKWVDAETFAKSTAPNEVYFPQQAASTVARKPANPEPRSAAKPKSSIPWLPWGQPQRR